MSTSKETINKDQPGDTPIEMCQTKMPKSLGKRKIVAEVVSPVKQCKIVRDRVANPDNCYFCDKKLKFINTFKCRCEMYFCNKHRFSDQHGCSFDFKTEARSKLKENNPKIVAKKLGE